ncbi:MAG: lanthionine synthetase C family protein [Acidobacteriota bacterium]
MTEAWQPLLTGEQADRAWAAIHAIARDIGPAGAGQAPVSRRPAAAWGLAGGAAGKALFFAYLTLATGDEQAAEAAHDFLEAALAGAAGEPLTLGLWEGLLGVTWTYDHLAGRLFETDDSESTSDADALLLRLLDGPRSSVGHGLISGLAGYGIACLEGLPRPGARRALDRILDHLLVTAESTAEVCRWFTPARLLPDWQRQLAPGGYYDVGVAHGNPAVLALLARCVGAGLRADELTPVLERCVKWVLDQGTSGRFPGRVVEGVDRLPKPRLSWCYGDPGVAGALRVAAAACGRADWQEQAVRIARRTATREPGETGIDDASLCNGSAGLAHVFHRFYRATGDAELGRAARFWFADSLDRRQPDRGVGGFQACVLPPGKTGRAAIEWVDEPGLLTGAAGTGLCLLAAVSDLEPVWDRCVLLSP